MVQKATEMGAASLTPVLTQYTQKAQLNYERLKANMVEAAEQCNLLQVPEFNDSIDLELALEKLSETLPSRSLVFCDEGAGPILTKDSRQRGRSRRTKKRMRRKKRRRRKRSRGKKSRRRKRRSREKRRGGLLLKKGCCQKHVFKLLLFVLINKTC